MNAAPRTGSADVELVINWGLGVDSTAYLVKMLEDPSAHGVDLARTMVLHELTGDEWPATRAHAAIGKSGYQNLRNARGESLRQLSGCGGVLEAGLLFSRAAGNNRTRCWPVWPTRRGCGCGTIWRRCSAGGLP